MNVLFIGSTGLTSTGITRRLVDAGNDVSFTRGQTKATLPETVNVVHGDGQSLWEPCHRDDIASALVAAVETPTARGETYHVTSEEVITWNQYHHVVADALDAPEPDLVHVPTDALLEAAPEQTEGLKNHLQFWRVFDNAEARRDLGFEYTISFRDGVERTIDHLESAGCIDPWDSKTDDAIIEAWRSARSAFVAESSGESPVARDLTTYCLGTVVDRSRRQRLLSEDPSVARVSGSKSG